MQNKKIFTVELAVMSVLWLSITAILAMIIGLLPILLGIIVAGFFITLYVSLLSYYSCIDKMPSKKVQFVLFQILPIALSAILFDFITTLIIAFVLTMGTLVLLKAIDDISHSMTDHVKFKVKTIILPHTKGIVVWFMLLGSVFIYGNTLKTNPNGVFLDESFLDNQIQAWTPLLEQVSPGFNPNVSVGGYVSKQLNGQDLNLSNVNRDKIIQQQVDELSKKFELSLTPDTPITQALSNYVNKFITPWMSGPLWGAIVSLVVFLSFLPFVGMFQFGIRLMVNSIHNSSIKSKYINFTKQNIEKDTLSW